MEEGGGFAGELVSGVEADDGAHGVGWWGGWGGKGEGEGGEEE